MSVNIQILLSRDYYFPTLQIVFVWIAKCICLKYDKDWRKKSGHEWTTSGPYLPDFFVPGTQTPPVQTKLEKGKAREIWRGSKHDTKTKKHTTQTQKKWKGKKTKETQHTKRLRLPSHHVYTKLCRQIKNRGTWYNKEEEYFVSLPL